MKLFQKRNIPNYLSVFRILLLPVYFYLFYSVSKGAAAGILILCALTDMVDGYLARKYAWITDLGKLLDPLADKLATLCALGALASVRLLPIWICVLVALKELGMILASAVILRKKHIVVQSSWYGKVATILFYIVVLSLHFFSQMPFLLCLTLWWVLAVSMFGSALLYLIYYTKKLKNSPKD